MINYSRALEVATEAARQAGALLRAEFHRPGGPRGAGGHAEIDEQVERRIREMLLAEFPWGYRGEELGYTAGGSGKQIWLVDPHDGTSVFLRGRRGSAVSIAALQDGVPVLGVVYAFGYPDDDGDLISWAEGCGPMLRNGRPTPATARPQADDGGEFPPVVLLWAGADAHAQTALQCVQPARYATLPSIAYRLALVAAGDAEAAVSVSGPLGWDYAAGHALLRGAGGVLVNQAGDPVLYTRDGQSYASRCFGGNAALVRRLWPNDWTAVFAPVGRMDRPGFSLTAPQPGCRVADAALLARAQGCLLGQLTGDSLGSRVEFQSASRIAAAFPHGVRELADGGTWGILAGQPTDDSELALMLARTLVQHQTFAPGRVLQSYVHWYLSRPFDVGSTTAAALDAASRGTTADERLGFAAEAANASSQANGSLMRISPLGIFAVSRPGQVIEWARGDSRLTHPHPVCQDACAVFAATIAHAVGQRSSPRDAYETALVIAEQAGACGEVKQALRDAAHAPPADFQRHQGWVLIALQNAFYQLLHAADFQAGVVASVMAGGDTDTNAAIAGALLGAVHGRQAVPRPWLRAVLSCRPLRGTNTAHPRGTEFWPVDVLELAEALLIAGKP
jgi:ADP-ribosylglycohydrolase/fructose-1,6-bisphosphatase/inositol monophosphatase family enzyme